jgi:GDP-L-fucose synthase
LLTLSEPPNWVNVGTGEDHSILELAQLVAQVTGFQGQIVTDPTKPDGTPRKLTDITRLKQTGWNPTTDLEAGIRQTYEDFKHRLASGALRAV